MNAIYRRLFLVFAATLVSGSAWAKSLGCFATASTPAAALESYWEWVPRAVKRDGVEQTVRAGVLHEDPSVPFLGTVTYIQGITDSLCNHAELFGRLHSEGIRVLAFDFLGQGGSTGELSSIDLDWISDQAQALWQAKARTDGRWGTQRVQLGWSLGGLSVYRDAFRGKVDAAIVVSPAIYPLILALIS